MITITNILTIPAVMILWLIGGQINKAVRRYGVPGVALLSAVITSLKDDKNKNKWYKYLPLLVAIPILSIGYGTDSALKKVFKKDWIVRVVYGIILSLPFLALTLMTTNPYWKYIITVLSLCGAFSIQAGSLGRIGTFDILIEDIIRSAVLGINILLFI